MKNEIKSEKCTRYLCAILDENIFQRTYQQKKMPHSYAKTSEDQM